MSGSKDGKGYVQGYVPVGKQEVTDEDREIVKLAVMDRISLADQCEMNKYDRARLLASSRTLLGLSQREFSEHIYKTTGRRIPKSTLADWELPIKAGSKEEYTKKVDEFGEKTVYKSLRTGIALNEVREVSKLNLVFQNMIIHVKLLIRERTQYPLGDSSTTDLIKELRDSLNHFEMYMDRSKKGKN